MIQNAKLNSRLREFLLIALILVISLYLRFYGITTESLWLDETCSVRDSQGDISEIIFKAASNIHPQFYYIGLHFWRNLFGDSDARIRAYSTMWSIIGLILIFLLARDLCSKRAGFIALILGAVNPFDIYFAQEARMYMQTTVFCTLSSWCLWRWMVLVNKSSQSAKWIWWAMCYILSAVAIIYTHYVAVTVLLAQGFFVLIWFLRGKRWSTILAYLASALIVAIAFLPWLLYVYKIRNLFYSSLHIGWIPRPPFNELYSFLGKEIFWGRLETIYDKWWIPTIVLPLAVIGIGFWQVRKRNLNELLESGESHLLRIIYPLWLLMGPVLLAVVISHLYHPVYYRPRFTLFVLPQFLILAGVIFSSFQKRVMQYLSTAILGIFMFTVTLIQSNTMQKEDWRSIVKDVPKNGNPVETVFFPPYFEIPFSYHLKKVFHSVPRERFEKIYQHINGTEVWVFSQPNLNYDGWDKDREYYNWLLGLGDVNAIALPNNHLLQIIKIGDYKIPEKFRERFNQWYKPYDINGSIYGFNDYSNFYGLEGDERGDIFRWAFPTGCLRFYMGKNVRNVTLNIEFPPPLPPGYKPEFKIYIIRDEDAKTLFDNPPAVTIDEYRSGPLEIAVPIPKGSGIIWLGWKINKVNLAKTGVSKDNRDLGIRVNWVGLN